jgi:OOP family OmpA-OmpF porin
MKLRSALLAATIATTALSAPHRASAQPVTGPYVGLEGGYNIEESQKSKNVYLNGVAQPDTMRINTHNGYVGEAAAGYGFGDGFRVEVEGDFYQNNFDKTKVAGTQASARGREKKYGAFVNGYYDFDIGLPYLFPYLGAGVGYQEDQFNAFKSRDIFTTKTKGALAYQGIAGLSIPIPSVPGLSVTLEYRFTALTGSRKFNGATLAGQPAAFKAEREYHNSFMGGLRYQIFTPQPVPPAPAPAPMAAAPAPVPAKTYLVFFDWDKSSLTPRATTIIAQAASDSKTAGTTTLDVSGYTDTSGTPTYNQGLSERRANAVAAQLVTDGVPSSAIEIHAYGETHLLVPTGPGVREPQNRRVEIVLN